MLLYYKTTNQIGVKRTERDNFKPTYWLTLEQSSYSSRNFFEIGSGLTQKAQPASLTKSPLLDSRYWTYQENDAFEDGRRVEADVQDVANQFLKFFGGELVQNTADLER